MIEHFISHWARQTPGKIAIIYSDQSITYLQLYRLIVHARSFLIRHGHAGEGYAAVCTPNLLHFWICSLALRGLGYTTIQIDHPSQIDQVEFPERPKFFMFEGDKSNHNLFVDKLNGDISSIKLDDISLSNFRSIDVSQKIGGNLLRTSGTTGYFKLVLMSPEMDEFLLRQKNEVTGMDQQTVLGAFNFPAWTAAGYRWAASPWRVGGTVVLRQGRDLHHVLRHDLTHAVLTPALLERILETPENSFPRNEQLKLTVGGGAMTRAQIELALARITPNLFNLLASTEGGVIAHTPIRHRDDMGSHMVVKERQVEIVDGFDRPVVDGEVGRLRVLQGILPNQYLNNPAASAESFHGGYFYPGDLAARDSRGHLALHGRVADIINMGGFKMAPFTIERRVTDSLGIACCLFAMVSPAGQEELALVLECDARPELDSISPVLKGLRRFVDSVKIYHLPRFERTESGKVKRDKVRESLIQCSGSQNEI